MAEDKDPLVDDVDEDEEDETVEEDLVSEEELPESPALVDHTVDMSSGGVTYVRGPGGKLIPSSD